MPLEIVLYGISLILLVYIVINILRTKKFKTGDAIATLGIIVSIILAMQVTPQSITPLTTQARFSNIFEVFANLSWQDTGIQIKSGDRIRIIWDGKSKWRGANSGDFSDPLGGYTEPNALYSCPTLMPEAQSGWNALVAKIGENGIPSNPFKIMPSGEGNLFLAMNDCDEQRYDNEGSAIVTIEVTR